MFALLFNNNSNNINNSNNNNEFLQELFDGLKLLLSEKSCGRANGFVYYL